MTADLPFTDATQPAQEILARRSDILDFELLCGFNNWLLGYVLDDLRERTFPTANRYGWPDQVGAALTKVCEFTTALMAPVLSQGRPVVSRLTPFDAQAEPAIYAKRATKFCLDCVLGELQGPDRRWAHGRSDETLAKDAHERRLLVIAFTDEVFDVLRELAASFDSVDICQFSRSIKAAEVVLQAALTILWSIDSTEDMRDAGLDTLAATLDEEVDSEAVREAGQLAERAMHRIWMRLHSEIDSIERRQAAALA